MKSKKYSIRKLIEWCCIMVKYIIEIIFSYPRSQNWIFIDLDIVVYVSSIETKRNWPIWSPKYFFFAKQFHTLGNKVIDSILVGFEWTSRVIYDKYQ